MIGVIDVCTKIMRIDAHTAQIGMTDLVNIVTMKRRKIMTEECLKCEYATYDCQSYGACRKRWFLDRLDRDLEKDEAEEDNGTD